MSNGYPEQVKTYLPHPWQLFKNAWNFYRHHFKLIIQITIWPALISVVTVFPSLWLRPVLSLISLVVILLAQAALIHILTREEGVEGATYRSAYRHAWEFFLSLIWLNLLLVVIMFGGFVILVIPGLIWMVYLMFSMLILIDQRRRGLSALVSSWAYAEGYWWPLLGRILFLTLLMLPVAALVSLLGWVAMALWPSVGLWLSPTISILGTWLLISPLSLIYFFYIYSELKALKPNVEVEVISADLKRRWLSAFTIVGLGALVLLLILAIASFSFVLGLITGSVGGSIWRPVMPSGLSLPPGSLSAGLSFWGLDLFNH